MCCAGITEDGQALLRLFPIRYRRLPKDDQFDRFDLVEMTITKASDPRPESYRIDEGSIHRLEPGNKLADSAKVRLWTPFIAPSLKDLIAENLDKTLEQVKILAGNVNDVVSDNKARIDNIVENLESTAVNFKEFSADIKKNPWKLLIKK